MHDTIGHNSGWTPEQLQQAILDFCRKARDPRPVPIADLVRDHSPRRKRIIDAAFAAASVRYASFRDEIGTPIDMQVLYFIGVHSDNDHWRCAEPVTRIASIFDVDRRTIGRRLEILTDRGFLQVEHSAGRTSRYNLVYDRHVVECSAFHVFRAAAPKMKPATTGVAGSPPTTDVAGVENAATLDVAGAELEPRQSSERPATKVVAQQDYLQDYNNYTLGDAACAVSAGGQACTSPTPNPVARARAQTVGELNGRHGIVLDNTGKLTVDDTVASTLLADFPGIDLAEVCDRAVPEITKLNLPTALQAKAVLRKWARVMASDKAKSHPGPRAASVFAKPKKIVGKYGAYAEISDEEIVGLLSAIPGSTRGQIKDAILDIEVKFVGRENLTTREVLEALNDAVKLKVAHANGEASPAHGDRVHNGATVTHWGWRLEAFREKQHWREDYGPKPNQPGCLAPAELLVEFAIPVPVALSNEKKSTTC